jgi:hypothetical protein
MKKILIIVIVLAALFIIFGRGEGSKTYTGESVRLTFNYPNGYVLTEKPTEVILMTEKDYASLQRGEREGGEGPPAIVIREYNNPNNPGPRDWAEQYPQLSNYNLIIGAAETTTVSGFEGTQYRADGLYPNQNVVFADNVRIYHINGSYLDQGSNIYRDFEKIVGSIKVR